MKSYTSERRKQGDHPRLERLSLARTGAFVLELGAAALILTGCGGFPAAQAKDVANASSIGKGLTKAGYTLVDVNGRELTMRVDGLPLPDVNPTKGNITYLEYRQCNGLTVTACMSRPLAPGELEPLVAILHPPQEDGGYSKEVAAVLAGAETRTLVIGIGSYATAASLDANTGIPRLRSDAASPGSASATQLPNSDFTRAR